MPPSSRAELGRPPGLATVLVGDDPASHVYVRNKRKQTEEAGMRSIHHELAAETSPDELLDLVGELNADDAVDGILVQLPLPAQHRPGRGHRGASTQPRTSTASPRPAPASSPRAGPAWCRAPRRG